MEQARLRPLFKLDLPVRAPRFLGEIRRQLGTRETPYVGVVLRSHAELTVRAADRHFWSPHLSLDVFALGAHTQLRGRYGPHPSIWTFMMAVYGVLSIGALASIVMGLSQWTLGWSPWGFAALPVLATMLAFTWWAGSRGQRLAQGQMEQLHAFVQGCAQRVSEPPGPS